MQQKHKAAIVIAVGVAIYFLYELYGGKIMRTVTGSATAPSQSLRDYIKSKEGFSSTPYFDPPGQTTTRSIGYGHQLQPGESTAPWSAAQAEDQLNKDIDKAASEAVRLTDVPLTQGMLDSITDFIYNVGAGNFQKSTLRQRINYGAPIEMIQAEFSKWTYANGVHSEALAARREYEYNLYLS